MNCKIWLFGTNKFMRNQLKFRLNNLNACADLYIYAVKLLMEFHHIHDSVNILALLLDMALDRLLSNKIFPLANIRETNCFPKAIIAFDPFGRSI